MPTWSLRGTSRNEKLTLSEAANDFQWPRNFQVQLEFDDREPQPAPIQLRSNIYSDATHIEMCKSCHKVRDHARDCPLREKEKSSCKDKLEAYSRKLKNNDKDGQSATHASGMSSAYATTRRTATCGMIKKSSKLHCVCSPEGDQQEQTLQMGPSSDSHDAVVCRAKEQGRCMYHHQDWNQELNKHTYAAIEEDPNIHA